MPADDENTEEPLPRYIVEAHGPEPEAPGRGDWKLLVMAGGAFLVCSIGMGVGLSDQRAVIIPLVASAVCILFGLWKLARLKDRNAKEEQALGFLSMFLLGPLHLQFMFLPFLLVLVIKRDTTLPDAKGKFGAGAGFGCLAIFGTIFLLVGIELTF